MPKSFEDKELFFLPLEQLNIVQWSPGPKGDPVTQVHFIIEIEGADFAVGLRFKGPGTMGKIIEAMIRHRREVWPGADEPW